MVVAFVKDLPEYVVLDASKKDAHFVLSYDWQEFV